MAPVGCFVLLLPALVWAAADRGVLVRELQIFRP
jgi:hypothetical protein